MSIEDAAEEVEVDGVKETVKVIIHALILALIVRVFIYQPFNIPSGSMKETLLIGDYLFVSKMSYGYSKYSFPFSPDLFDGRFIGDAPERGDVAVFKLPSDNETDYIKRVIGLPGDTVQMRDGTLYLNGKMIPKVRDGSFATKDYYGRSVVVPRYKETLPNGIVYHVLDTDPEGPFDNTGIFRVPEGHFFMMGDNRDNSSDSRARRGVGVGYVPLENFVGRAEVLFFSADETWSIFKPWNWPSSIRWSRFFNLIR